MRFSRTRVVMAVTAVMVVVWAGMASGTNGDALKAGQATSATAQTTLTTTQASGNGFQVNLSGTTTGAAIRGNGTTSGVGVFGTSANPNGAAVQGIQNSATHGTGAAGSFGGGHNNGINAGTGNANSFGVKGISNAATHGTGSAGLFVGGHNDGAVATTADGSSVAVRGTNSAGGTALAGISDAAGGTGVYGEATGSGGLAGAFNGDVHVAGAVGTTGDVNVGGALAVGSSGLVSNLNADMVDGYHASELVRAARGNSQNFFPFATYTGQTSLTITAPAAGFVLVTGTGFVETTDSSCNYCYVHARLHDTTADTVSPNILESIGDGTTKETAVALTPTWIFPVDAGNRTFELQTAPFPGTASLLILNPSITALYVPFGSTGGGTLRPHAIQKVKVSRDLRAGGTVARR